MHKEDHRSHKPIDKNLIRNEDEFLVFGAPAIEEDEIREVLDSMRSGWLGTGPKVERFEEAFKTYKHARNAVAVSSGTAALHLSLLASGIKPGDEVITTALTFCATVNAIIHSGATPVLVDVDPLTMNMDPQQAEAKIGPKTRAILPVHFAGRPCDMDALCDLADRHGLKMIEDGAHAIETEYKGRPVGTFGDFGCFSFYATKNITTGEGGMVLTRQEEDANRIKILAFHGMTQNAWKRFKDDGHKHYHVVEAGFKYNMTDMQAAIGIHQLKRIEAYWRYRQATWNRYRSAFAELPIGLPTAPQPETRHSYHLYTILIDEAKTRISRDAFLETMTANNIGVGVHYLSIPEHPYYQETFGFKPEDYPNAMRLGRQTVSLPLSPKLKDEDVNDVIRSVQKVLG